MNTWTSQDDCPVCGQPEALIDLGARYDRLHRWRPWIITMTRLALCSACDALVATEDSRPATPPAHGPRTDIAPGAASRPPRRAAAPATACARSPLSSS